MITEYGMCKTRKEYRLFVNMVKVRHARAMVGVEGRPVVSSPRLLEPQVPCGIFTNVE